LLLFLSASWLCSKPALAEQFSIECPWIYDVYITFDTDALRVVYEVANGSALKGQITLMSPQEVRFDLLRVGTPPFNLIWNTQTGKLTSVGIPSDPTRPTTVHDCHRAPLRPILSLYDRIAPY
jgi:hypothetical protein